VRALGVVALVVACGVAATEVEVSPSPPSPPSIGDVKRRHEAELLALPGVVSVGIGEDASGSPVLVVGVRSAEASPRLPRELEGYPVTERVVGRVRAR
jgi:hypothetical protein